MLVDVVCDDGVVMNWHLTQPLTSLPLTDDQFFDLIADSVELCSLLSVVSEVYVDVLVEEVEHYLSLVADAGEVQERGVLEGVVDEPLLIAIDCLEIVDSTSDGSADGFRDLMRGQVGRVVSLSRRQQRTVIQIIYTIH